MRNCPRLFDHCPAFQFWNEKSGSVLFIPEKYLHLKSVASYQVLLRTINNHRFSRSIALKTINHCLVNDKCRGTEKKLF